MISDILSSSFLHSTPVAEVREETGFFAWIANAITSFFQGFGDREQDRVREYQRVANDFVSKDVKSVFQATVCYKGEDGHKYRLGKREAFVTFECPSMELRIGFEPLNRELVLSGDFDPKAIDKPKNQNASGYSFVARAIMSNDIELLKVLVDKGADVNEMIGISLDHRGCSITPLELALGIGNEEIIRYMFQLKALDFNKHKDVLIEFPQYSHFAPKKFQEELASNRFKTASEIGDSGSSTLFCHDIADAARKSEKLPDGIKEKIANIFSDANDNKLSRNLANTAQRIREGERVLINAGWDGHAICLIFEKGLLHICNRGKGSYNVSDGDSGDEAVVATFAINSQLVTKGVLSRIILKGEASFDEGRDFFYETLPQILSIKPGRKSKVREEMPVANPVQRGGSCTFTSPQQAFYRLFKSLNDGIWDETAETMCEDFFAELIEGYSKAL